MKFDFGKNVSPGQKGENDATLTSMGPHDKITWQYAGMVELVDSVDLGSSVLDVQVRVLLPAPLRVAITNFVIAAFLFAKSVMNTRTEALRTRSFSCGSFIANLLLNMWNIRERRRICCARWDMYFT